MIVPASNLLLLAFLMFAFLFLGYLVLKSGPITGFTALWG